MDQGAIRSRETAAQEIQDSALRERERGHKGTFEQDAVRMADVVKVWTVIHKGNFEQARNGIKSRL